MTGPFFQKNYLALALDPIHIGTGGYRLGRVDNTIVREPGTQLPKIPGSSISGVARAYTAMAVQNENPMIPKMMKYKRPISRKIKDKNGQEQEATIFFSCAGKGAEDGKGHCGEPDCPVCIAFGFSKGESGSSFQGLAQFFDARILFYPVHSKVGPVWITSPSLLEAAAIMPSADYQETVWNQLNTQLSQISEQGHHESYFAFPSLPQSHLNLGWIYLPFKPIHFNQNKEIPDPSGWGTISANNGFATINELGIHPDILNRLVLVSDMLLYRIVNDNLEVRTSVAIDPLTGAGEEGALFTYEAIPRGTVLWFHVAYNKPEFFCVGTEPIKHGKQDGQGWNWVCENVEKGLHLMEHMGVGGMGTRGMGRIKILNRERV